MQKKNAAYPVNMTTIQGNYTELQGLEPPGNLLMLHSFQLQSHHTAMAPSLSDVRVHNALPKKSPLGCEYRVVTVIRTVIVSAPCISLQAQCYGQATHWLEARPIYLWIWPFQKLWLFSYLRGGQRSCQCHSGYSCGADIRFYWPSSSSCVDGIFGLFQYVFVFTK